MSKVTWRELDENAAAAMTAFFTRTGIEAVETRMPFAEMMRSEREDPEIRRRLAGILAEMRRLNEVAVASQAAADIAAVAAYYDKHSADIQTAYEFEQKVDEVSESDVRIRMDGVRIFMRYLTARGWHPASILKQLIASGRALHESPWCDMTMEEAAMLMSETKAAHSHRCMLLSGEIKLSGQRGARMPGQKTDAARETYKKIRKGNTSRKGGRKFIRKPQIKTP